MSNPIRPDVEFPHIPTQTSPPLGLKVARTKSGYFEQNKFIPSSKLDPEHFLKKPSGKIEDVFKTKVSWSSSSESED